MVIVYNGFTSSASDTTYVEYEAQVNDMFSIPRGRDGTVTSGDSTSTSDLIEAMTYIYEKFSELLSNLTSHTHEQLALVDQDVKISANLTFGTATADKIIKVVYA